MDRQTVNGGGAAEDAVRIATRLLARAGDGRVFLFTSGGAGEGAGAAAAAVARALTRLVAGAVLVLDADLDVPRLHVRFDSPRTPGVAEVLRDESPLAGAIHSTGVERLALMPAGESIEDRVFPLAARGLARILDEARGSFAYVIVHAPGLLDRTVAPVLATFCDGVVLVVAAGEHSRARVIEMQRELRSLRARIVGSVLSRAGH